MIVGFTGTQEGLNRTQRYLLARLFDNLPVVEFHHGDCIGADVEANNIFVDHIGAPIVIHPPANQSKRAWSDKYQNPGGYTVLAKRDYLVRNKDIVNECNILIACPKSQTEELRSGTWSTIRYAIRVDKPYMILG